MSGTLNHESIQKLVSWKEKGLKTPKEWTKHCKKNNLGCPKKTEDWEKQFDAFVEEVRTKWDSHHFEVCHTTRPNELRRLRWIRVFLFGK